MATKGNPGGKGPISTQGGRKSGGGKNLKGTTDSAPWPGAAKSPQGKSGTAFPASKGPLSGLGGGKGGSHKPTRGGSAKTGGGGTTTS